VAADQGYAPAQFHLGFIYEEGLGVLEDKAEAMKWYRKSADQGFALAQEWLGMKYTGWPGLPRNQTEKDEGIMWLRKAADQGSANAQNALGGMYLEGHGVPRSSSEAVKWFRMSADQDHTQWQLGIRDFGFRQNYAEDLENFARRHLGIIYELGLGLPQNYAEAATWFRKAADRGDSDAQVELGKMYLEGRGVPQNYVLAHMWFNLAAAKEYNDNYREGSLNRERTEKMMTPAQVTEAQKLAHEWKPITQPR
jgi:TPR repeat protein